MSCVIYLSALAIPAYSATCEDTFITKDWNNIGDNLITLDTISGLEWLDLTATASRSYDDVVANLGVGGDFEGWRLAITSQVYTVLKNAGVRLPDANGRDVPTLTNAAAYNDLMGAQDLGTVTTSRGIVSDLDAATDKIGYVRIRNSTWEWSTKLCNPFPVTGVSEVIGTYLQRPAVTEPFVPALVGLGRDTLR